MSLFDRVAPKLARLSDRLDEIDRLISDPSVASDGARLTAILRERGQLARTVEPYREILRLRREREETLAERERTADPAMKSYCDEILAADESRLPQIENQVLAEFVKDEDDGVESAILEIRAGTGGDEASLWARDLCRMYARHAERRGWKVEMLEESRSPVDGYKSVILNVTGAGAYAALKFESGGHRVQRVPVTEAQGRIHTSAATVAVLPEATEVQVDIKDSDLKIDTYRASGPGGQNVNKVEAAIRITHLPSGLVVSCQDERSQGKNKAKAMKILRSRLYDHERQRQHQERSSKRRSLIGSGDRSERIRTYNYPDSRVTDHRINLSRHDLESVLDGALGPMIEALHRFETEQRLEELAAG